MTWNDQFAARETITEVTEDNLREMYFAQIAHMRQLCGTIIDNNWYTDSAHDEMTGCLDLLQAFHHLNDAGPDNVTVDLLRRVIDATCCDSVAPLVYALLFDSEDHYFAVGDATPPLSTGYDPYEELRNC